VKNMITDIFFTYCCLNDNGLTIESDCGELSGLLGYSENEIKNVFGNQLFKIAEGYESAELRRELDAQLSTGTEIELVYSICKKNGETIWVLNRGRWFKKENNQEYILGLLVEITQSKYKYDELKKEQKKAILTLREQAEKDSLTKLLNASTARRLTEEYLSVTNDNCAALLVIDLDNFKQVNDRHGHMFGDKVLIQAAQMIQKHFRSQDIIGRIGGDEFMVFMKDVNDNELLTRRCEQLLITFQDTFREPVYECKISCSIGIAVFPAHGKTYSELFGCADKALYQAKAEGKNCYTLGNR